MNGTTMPKTTEVKYPPPGGPWVNVNLVPESSFTPSSLAPPAPPAGTTGMIVEATIASGGPGHLLQVRPTGAVDLGDVQSLFQQGGPVNTKLMVIRTVDGSFEYTLSAGPTGNIRIVAWLIH